MSAHAISKKYILVAGAVGSLVGIWLAGRHNFGDILDQGGDQFLPVPRGDHGA